MRERRDELGLTQPVVAARISPTTQAAEVSRWETGKHRPHPDTIDAIAVALETTVADLISGPLVFQLRRGRSDDRSDGSLLNKKRRQPPKGLTALSRT